MSRLMPALALLPLLLGGCSGLLSQPDPTTVWKLEINPAQIARAPEELPLSLRIDAPIAWSGHDSPLMAYERNPPRIDYYASNRWVAPPAQMLGESLVTAFQASGRYRAVLGSDSLLIGDYSLRSELVELTHAFVSGGSVARLVLRLSLIDNAQRQVIASARIETSEPVTSTDAEGFARASTLALQRAVGETLGFCDALLATRASGARTRPLAPDKDIR